MGLWKQHFHWSVLLRWEVLGWTIGTLLAVGGIVLFFDQYWGANICFMLVSVFIFAKVAHVAILSPDPPWQRLLFTFLLFGIVGVGIVETVRGVKEWGESKRKSKAGSISIDVAKTLEKAKPETALYLDCAYEGFPIIVPAGTTIHVVRVHPQTIREANHDGAFRFLDVRANGRDRVWPHDDEAAPLLLRTYQGLPIKTGTGLRCTVRKYGQGTVARAIIHIQVGDFFNLFIAPLESSGTFESFTFYLINACYPDVKPGAHSGLLNPFVGGFPDKAKLQVLGESDWKEVPLSVAFNANSMGKMIFLQPVYRRWKDLPPC